jgi:hypothetical protein
MAVKANIKLSVSLVEKIWNIHTLYYVVSMHFQLKLFKMLS